MRWLRLALYLVPVLLAVLAWYFLGGLRSYDQVDPGAITFAISTEPIGIDPLTDQDRVSEEIESLLFNSLLGRNAEMEMERHLMESWSYASRARYFYLTPRHADAAWEAFKATKEEHWQDWGILEAAIDGDEIRVELATEDASIPDKILEVLPEEGRKEACYWDIRTTHSAPSAFASFREDAFEAPQIRRTWSFDEDYLEVVTAGREQDFLRELTNWYESNPALDPRIQLSRREPYLRETSMTIHLRSGVTWHDGTPVTMDDVLHSLELARNSGNQPLVTSVMRAMQRMEPDGPLSLRITWRLPFARSLEVWERLKVLPAHSSHIFPDPSGAALTGTGPFRIRRWAPGEPILLERNDQYFLGRPDNRRIIYDRVIENRLRRILFETNAIDSYAASPTTFDRLEKRLDYQLVRGDFVERTHVAWNMSFGPLANERIRHALAHAIDVETLIEEIRSGHGQPVDRMFHPAMPWGKKTVKPLRYNPGRARRLLEEAGYDTLRFGQRYNDDGPLEFTLTRVSGDEFSRDLALALQRYWDEVGVDVSIHIASWGEMSAIRNGKSPFEAVLLTTDLEHLLDQFGRWHSTEIGPGRGNFHHLRDEEVNFTLERIRRETDPKAEQDLASMLQNRLHLLQPSCDIFLSGEARVFLKDRLYVRDRTREDEVTRPVGEHEGALTRDLAWWVKNEEADTPSSEPAEPTTVSVTTP